MLVWAGGGGDDLAKSPHLARIGNSVFHGHCGADPTCSNFGFYQDRSPTPMMAKSLLFKLVSYGRQVRVRVRVRVGVRAPNQRLVRPAGRLRQPVAL